MFLGYEGRKGLKHILENKKILKLIHDCRNDWDSLLHQYSVRLYNFLDTQEAYFVFKLFYFQEITLPISLMNFVESVLKIKLKYKEQFKYDIISDPYLWEKRPIDTNNLNYAAEDVHYLIKAWLELREKFNPNMKEIVINFFIKNKFKKFYLHLIYFQKYLCSSF
jgi:ribonuclease D